MRVGFSVGDGRRRPEIGFGADGRAVSADDRAALAAVVGAGPARLVFMEQVHGGRAVWVDGSNAGAGLAARMAAVAGADAMVTDDASIALVGLSADCPLVAIWSPAEGGASGGFGASGASAVGSVVGRQTVGVVHAGWRGLAAGVIAAAVELMVDRGAVAAGLRALVGPSIGPCCYEVGEELRAEMLAAGAAEVGHFERAAIAGAAGADVAAGGGGAGSGAGGGGGDVAAGGGVRLDLRGVVRYQLVRAGLDVGRIGVSGRCTRCDDRLHSYRRGGDAGRQGLVIRCAGKG